MDDLFDCLNEDPRVRLFNDDHVIQKNKTFITYKVPVLSFMEYIKPIPEHCYAFNRIPHPARVSEMCDDQIKFFDLCQEFTIHSSEITLATKGSSDYVLDGQHRLSAIDMIYNKDERFRDYFSHQFMIIRIFRVATDEEAYHWFKILNKSTVPVSEAYLNPKLKQVADLIQDKFKSTYDQKFFKTSLKPHLPFINLEQFRNKLCDNSRFESLFHKDFNNNQDLQDETKINEIITNLANVIFNYFKEYNTYIGKSKSIGDFTGLSGNKSKTFETMQIAYNKCLESVRPCYLGLYPDLTFIDSTFIWIESQSTNKKPLKFLKTKPFLKS